MIRPNSIHWNMTASTDDRVVYLSVMRNLKTYCRKGFCDFFLAAYRFSDYPASLAKRMIKPYRHVPPFIFDWNDEESVHIHHCITIEMGGVVKVILILPYPLVVHLLVDSDYISPFTFYFDFLH